MFDCSRVVALLLAKFGQSDVTNTTHQKRKMAEAFERVLLDAAYCDLSIEDEEDLEANNDEKMDIDWDIDCENIRTRSSPSNTSYIEFGGKPIPIEQDIVNLSTNQCGFVARCGTTDAIHATRLLIGKHRVLYDKNILDRPKPKIYRFVVRPVALYAT
ncbi:hypothetical protein Y032_0290g1547 [Ancylostoma ceylanicum]|uniref:Uncharacterized protein n=1 Tax=Ancylostoma ceylanicum TaxID=53326 RepID=A0A016S649_9BILA|nr:hypothetical protein Y032_0290g1547 [Ancylostoma ceylanicum]